MHQALADHYFKGLAKVEREPARQPITKMEFEFERRRVTKEDIKELIFMEILEYHPQLLKNYTNGTGGTNFLYPSAVDQFRRQFAQLEENGGNSVPVIPLERKHASLPRSTMVHSTAHKERADPRDAEHFPSHASQMFPLAKPGKVIGPVMPLEDRIKEAHSPPGRLPPSHTSSRAVSEAEEEQSSHSNKQLKPSDLARDSTTSSPFFLGGGIKPDPTHRLPAAAVSAISGDHRKVAVLGFSGWRIW